MKKREKIESKIKKPQQPGAYNRKLKQARMGTPPLEERELTEEQKKFAMLIARNMPIDMAAGHCGFSEYQRKHYIDLPKIKDEIAKWKEVFNLEGIEKYLALWNEVVIEALVTLMARVKEGKITNQEIFKNILNKSVIGDDSSGDPNIKRTMKVTKTMMQKPKQITDQSGGGDIFSDLEQDNEGEIEETHEMTIEETHNKEEDE